MLLQRRGSIFCLVGYIVIIQWLFWDRACLRQPELVSAHTCTHTHIGNALLFFLGPRIDFPSRNISLAITTLRRNCFGSVVQEVRIFQINLAKNASTYSRLILPHHKWISPEPSGKWFVPAVKCQLLVTGIQFRDCSLFFLLFLSRADMLGSGSLFKLFLSETYF